MNDAIFYFFYGLAYKYPWFDELIIFVAETLPFIIIASAGLFLLFHHEVFKAESPGEVLRAKWKEMIVVFLTSVLAYVVASLLKVLFQALRPFERMIDAPSLFAETGFAFPSGHATFFMALAFSIFFLHKRAGIVFMVFAFIIGISRIIAGVHFPVDILGGFVLGALVAYLVRKI